MSPGCRQQTTLSVCCGLLVGGIAEMLRKGRKVTLNYEDETQVAKLIFFRKGEHLLSLLLAARFSQLLRDLNSQPPASLTFRPQQ